MYLLLSSVGVSFFVPGHPSFFMFVLVMRTEVGRGEKKKITIQNFKTFDPKQNIHVPSAFVEGKKHLEYEMRSYNFTKKEIKT